MEKISRILLDMDLVIVDFDSGAKKAHGLTTEELVAEYGSWWGGDDFWRPILAKGETFWSSLPPLPWARELVDLVDSLDVEWFVVSDPSGLEEARRGKIEWCRDFFGDRTFMPELTSRKYLLAKPDVLLIDDSENNIDVFDNYGGRTLLFPARHNQFNLDAKNPMPFVRETLLGEFKCI